MLFRTADMPLSSTLEEYRACFSKPQFRHFKTFMSGLMLNGKNEKNIMDISSSALDGRSQSCLNRFLHGSKWSSEMLDHIRLDTYARGKEGGVLIIDDTLIEKSGHSMEGAGWLFDHSQGRNIWCHDYLTSLYSDGEDRVPMHLVQYLKKEICPQLGKVFKTKLELAIDLIDMDLEYVRPKAVVFDSWFGSQELMGHIQSKGLPYITEAKGNRLIQTEDGPVQARVLLTQLNADVFLAMEGDGQYHYCMEKVTEIKGGMTVKFLFFKEKQDDKGALVLMTNALDMPVQDVLRYYKMRWDVEVFYRDCKQYLGMGEYQVRKIDVGVIHLLLVILAYTILKGIARTRSFQNIFKGADAVGSMCDALKRHVALKMFKPKAFG
jgi:hypothetical protein